MRNIYEVQSANKLKSALIITLFAIFIFIATYVIVQALGIYLGYEPGGLGFLGVALILSGISTFFGYYFSDKIVLGISRARPATTREDKLFTSVVENLCLGAGVPKPRLFVIDDSAPNAFATGRDPEHAVICATTGLLDKLDRSELEGVLGHELTHIRNFDIRLMSIVAVMVGLVALLADWFLRVSWHGGHDGDRKNNNLGAIILVLGIVFAILSPIIAQLIQLAISRRREFMADAGGIELTRQPQGLISALEKISADREPLEAANKATAHLYIISPFKANDSEQRRRVVNLFANLFNTHPSLEERIKILKNMI